MSTHRVAPAPGAVAWCPQCSAPLVAKCGEERIHHWAHANSRDCDRWAEGESDWHLSWKRLVRQDSQEVTIAGAHRADIVGNGGTVIELQHSHISSHVVREREAFYGSMVWLFHGENDVLKDCSWGSERIEFLPPRRWGRWLTCCEKPLFVDTERDLSKLFGLLSEEPLTIVEVKGGGRRWHGSLMSRDEFCHKYLSDVLLSPVKVEPRLCPPATPASKTSSPSIEAFMGKPKKIVAEMLRSLSIGELVALDRVWFTPGTGDEGHS